MTTLFTAGLPVGAILPFGGPSTAVPDGFLLCNGALINRNDYADLFAIIQTYWGAGDGLTTFNIPTTQGLLLRGVAYGSGNDPDSASRTATQAGGQTGDEVGSFQNWRVQQHQHTYQFRAFTNLAVNGATSATGNGYNEGAFGPFVYGTSGLQSAAYNGNVNDNSVRGARARTSNVGSNQTVGQNVYTNFIIKY